MKEGREEGRMVVERKDRKEGRKGGGSKDTHVNISSQLGSV